jgi:hypothetical protein
VADLARARKALPLLAVIKGETSALKIWPPRTGQTFSANRPAREGALLERPQPDWLFLVAII